MDIGSLADSPWKPILSSGAQHLLESFKKRGVRGIDFEEEIHWRQKVGVKWVKEGDCNSKFFHKVANGRRNRKYIKVLENERGLVLNNSESIKEEILYFEKLYSSPFRESWRVEGLDWSSISGESAFRLDSPFTEEEIFKDVIKEDLVRVFAEFHRSEIINQSTNASFIVLVPKKSMSKKISDFRPISLITSLYKIIAKVLSGRLRRVLNETIHSTQDAFVQGRQIFDAVLIANEIVDEKRRSGGKELSSKLILKRLTTICTEQDVIEQKKEMPWRVSGWVGTEQGLAELLDCKAFGWPILYLGFPLGGNPKACGFWDPVFERISRRLDGWQKVFPALVAAKIERLQRDFLWSGVGEGKRDHLVSWDIVYNPKAKGGVGFGKISIRNLALLGKWLWRYPRKGSTLWHQSDGHIVVLGRLLHKSPRSFPSLLGDLEGLMWSLDRLHLSPSVSDMRSWSLSSLGLFTVKYFFLALSQFSGFPPVFPSKFVWNSQVPFKVKSFVWLVAHKKDIIARFGEQEAMPREFFTDFVKVAQDEGRHFTLLAARLEELGSFYGALPAHDGLWDSATATSKDLLARLAVEHCVHEVVWEPSALSSILLMPGGQRLDVLPTTISRFRNGGDNKTANLLERVVYPEEITHCAAGVKWFKYLCLRSRNPITDPCSLISLENEATERETTIVEDEKYVIQKFHATVRTHFRGPLKPPFNEEARKAAGFGPQWYEPLAVKEATQNDQK
ncbi:Transposon TX1 uncharacterized 149 kDa protein [Vitis vinifera]|uniref:Transposon TX1 uncharacterized 149 kDa protein n=1 Tax=Vitis vinifera TaxID=29760 RepID=A0A438GVK7_VITVI|nr:Transposon TX1 uncharacterized 149 kDa protein [Vitis vinifera]